LTRSVATEETWETGSNALKTVILSRTAYEWLNTAEEFSSISRTALEWPRVGLRVSDKACETKWNIVFGAKALAIKEFDGPLGRERRLADGV
jgi:hypothetical protein